MSEPNHNCRHIRKFEVLRHKPKSFRKLLTSSILPTKRKQSHLTYLVQNLTTAFVESMSVPSISKSMPRSERRMGVGEKVVISAAAAMVKEEEEVMINKN